jgi:hypothetical protein
MIVGAPVWPAAQKTLRHRRWCVPVDASPGGRTARHRRPAPSRRTRRRTSGCPAPSPGRHLAGRAERDQGAWYGVEHPREVLRRGQRVRQPNKALLAVLFADHRYHQVDFGGVVDSDGTLLGRLDLEVEPVRGRDPPADANRFAEDLAVRLAREGPQRRLERGRVRDDVGRGARVEGPDGDDHGVEDVERASHEGLQRRHHLARRRDRIACAIG